jgi:hypothetical protein
MQVADADPHQVQRACRADTPKSVDRHMGFGQRAHAGFTHNNPGPVEERSGFVGSVAL